MKEWIEQYHKAKIQVNRDNHPKDLSREATRWIALFHEKLVKLPKLHQSIFEKKYLEIETDSRHQLDDFCLCGSLYQKRNLLLKKE